jgi:hypothetical protein
MNYQVMTEVTDLSYRGDWLSERAAVNVRGTGECGPIEHGRHGAARGEWA